MSRVFLYSRVSTQDQDTTNQQIAAKQAGYEVEPRRVHAETISGTVPAMERPVFHKLVEKLEAGDTLVVAKLDRLGRNAADVDSTVQALRALGVRVVVLDLPVQEELYERQLDFRLARISWRTRIRPICPCGRHRNVSTCTTTRA